MPDLNRAPTSVRTPAVAGQFYPANPKALNCELERCLAVAAAAAPTPAIAGIVPHAGYIYSGHIAGAVFAQLQLPQRIILLGPNHTGRGAALSIMTRGTWATPLGLAAIDEPLAAELLRLFPALTDDAVAHQHEHSLEVEIPFLQKLRPEFSFVPICIGTHHLPDLEQLGQALAALIAAHGAADPLLLLASSDLNHYESDAVTRAKDALAIEQIQARDPVALMRTTIEHHISMCGVAPVVATLFAANALGATRADLIQYATSADVSGDRVRCVGYAGMIVR